MWTKYSEAIPPVRIEEITKSLKLFNGWVTTSTHVALDSQGALVVLKKQGEKYDVSHKEISLI